MFGDVYLNVSLGEEKYQYYSSEKKNLFRLICIMMWTEACVSILSCIQVFNPCFVLLKVSLSKCNNYKIY